MAAPSSRRRENLNACTDRCGCRQAGWQTLQTWAEQVRAAWNTDARARAGALAVGARGCGSAAGGAGLSPSLATDPNPILSEADEPTPISQVLSSGVVTRLHDDLYARLHHGKLVLLGGPGAGKTGQ